MFPYPQEGRHLTATHCPSYGQVSPVKVCLASSAEFPEESDPPVAVSSVNGRLHCSLLAV